MKFTNRCVAIWSWMTEHPTGFGDWLGGPDYEIPPKKTKFTLADNAVVGAPIVVLVEKIHGDQAE